MLLAGSRNRSRVPLLSPEVGKDVAMMVRGPKVDGYSGADLAALLREAGVQALRRALGTLEEMDSRPGPGPSSSGAGAAAAAVTLMLVLVRGRTRRGERWCYLRIFGLLLERLLPSISKNRRCRYEALRETFCEWHWGEGREGARGVESETFTFNYMTKYSSYSKTTVWTMAVVKSDRILLDEKVCEIRLEIFGQDKPPDV